MNKLYYATPVQNLTTLTNNKKTYAVDQINGSSLFGFQWNNNHDIEAGITPDNKWYFIIPKKNNELMKEPCSIYTILDTNSFIPRSQGLVGEYKSINPEIPVYDEIKFQSAEECMTHFGVKIIIK